jgi:hypothetical protein
MSFKTVDYLQLYKCVLDKNHTKAFYSEKIPYKMEIAYPNRANTSVIQVLNNTDAKIKFIKLEFSGSLKFKVCHAECQYDLSTLILSRCYYSWLQSDFKSLPYKLRVYKANTLNEIIEKVLEIDPAVNQTIKMNFFTRLYPLESLIFDFTEFTVSNLKKLCPSNECGTCKGSIECENLDPQWSGSCVIPEYNCPKGTCDFKETVFAYAMTEVDPGTFGNIFDAVKDKLSILAGLKLNAPGARLTINIMTMVSFLIIAIGLIKMNYEQQTALISQSVPTSVKFKNVRKTRN